MANMTNQEKRRERFIETVLLPERASWLCKEANVRLKQAWEEARKLGLDRSRESCSDPFAARRAFSHMMNGVATPADFV